MLRLRRSLAAIPTRRPGVLRVRGAGRRRAEQLRPARLSRGHQLGQAQRRCLRRRRVPHHHPGPVRRSHGRRVAARALQRHGTIGSLAASLTCAQKPNFNAVIARSIQRSTHFTIPEPECRNAAFAQLLNCSSTQSQLACLRNGPSRASRCANVCSHGGSAPDGLSFAPSQCYLRRQRGLPAGRRQSTSKSFGPI